MGFFTQRRRLETDPLSWSISNDQTDLTGDKSGSFDLSTTGNITSASLNFPNGEEEISFFWTSDWITLYTKTGNLASVEDNPSTWGGTEVGLLQRDNLKYHDGVGEAFGGGTNNYAGGLLDVTIPSQYHLEDYISFIPTIYANSRNTFNQNPIDFTLKIWNFNTDSWDTVGNRTNANDDFTAITSTISSNIGNYVENNKVYLLVRNTSASPSVSPSMYVDYWSWTFEKSTRLEENYWENSLNVLGDFDILGKFTVNSDILPNNIGEQDIGSSDYYFKNIYAKGQNLRDYLIIDQSNGSPYGALQIYGEPTGSVTSLVINSLWDAFYLLPIEDLVAYPTNSSMDANNVFYSMSKKVLNLPKEDNGVGYSNEIGAIYGEAIQSDDTISGADFGANNIWFGVGGKAWIDYYGNDDIGGNHIFASIYGKTPIVNYNGSGVFTNTPELYAGYFDGYVRVKDRLLIDSFIVQTPSTTQNITAAGGITVTNGIMRVQGSGGAVTVTATPSIAAGSDGQIVIIQGDSETNTLTLQDESTLTGSGLALNGGVNPTLGKGDILQLMYDSGDGKWYEISRSDN